MSPEEIRDYARLTRPTTRVAQGLPPDMVDAGQLDRLALLVLGAEQQLERKPQFATPFPPGCDAPTGATDSAPVVTGRGPSARRAS